MFKKGTKLYSILNNKCPRCQCGDFLVYRNPLKVHLALNIHKKCSHCGLKYMLEPSFYYGAMYVNYALSVAIAVITFTICNIFFGLGLVNSIIPVLGALLVCLPFTLRGSRIIWINFFVKYRKEMAD